MKSRKVYETPASKSMELKMQGVLCWSVSLSMLDQVLNNETVTQKDNFGDTWTWDN